MVTHIILFLPEYPSAFVPLWHRYVNVILRHPDFVVCCVTVTLSVHPALHLLIHLWLVRQWHLSFFLKGAERQFWTNLTLSVVYFVCEIREVVTNLFGDLPQPCLSVTRSNWQMCHLDFFRMRQMLWESRQRWLRTRQNLLGDWKE